MEYEKTLNIIEYVYAVIFVGVFLLSDSIYFLAGIHASLQIHIHTVHIGLVSYLNKNQLRRLAVFLVILSISGISFLFYRSCFYC